MQRLITVALALLLPAGGCLLQTRRPMSFRPKPPEGYVWLLNDGLSDEFDEPKLDGKKWFPLHPYWGGRLPSQFISDNVTMDHGHLILRSTARPRIETDGVAKIGGISVNAACLSSAEASASYGYYEARFRASRLSMSSSFWMQGKYSEIDIAEQMGAPLKSPEEAYYLHANTHFFKDSWKNDKNTRIKWRMPRGAADVDHTYGAWWKDEDTVWFYCDGKEVAKIKTGGKFLEPMYLFFDTEVFVDAGLPTDKSLKDALSNGMSVGWVRAWKLVRKAQAR